jgi:hypothetical protein
MQQNPGRMKITALMIALVVTLFFGMDVLLKAFLSSRPGAHPLLDSDSLALARGIFIFLSAYSLVTVLAFQYWRTAILNRFSARRGRFWAERLFLLVNYVLLICPAFCGLLFSELGSSLAEGLFFIGASILMMLAFAFYDFRQA